MAVIEKLSPRTQLLLTALASGAVVASSIFGVQALRRQLTVEELKASIPGAGEGSEAAVPDYSLGSIKDPSSAHIAASKEDEWVASLASKARIGEYDDELIDEQLTRTSSFLTPAGLSALRSSFVIIIGLGGVGSHCTAALVRSGVTHIRVIDFDLVTLSSLNRHAVATLADVGSPKVTCVRKRLEAVAPWVHWECINEVWIENKAQRLLGPWDGGKGREPDYVVDAIDNIDSKVALLRYCRKNQIRVVSSMGAGCKGDPTKVFIGDISATTEDPLSRSTRRRLKASGVSDGIPVVYSAEKPGPGKAALLPLPEEEYQKGSVGELSVLPDFRARILPVIGTMPAVFGYVAANFVIMEISGYPHEAGAGKGRDKMYESILQHVQGLEERLAKAEGQNVLGLRIALTKDDVGYLVDDVFRGKSVISGLPTRLTLVRWRSPENGYKAETKYEGQKCSMLQMEDLVCMTREEAVLHEKRVLTGSNRARPEDTYEADVVDLISERLREEAAYNRYR